MSAGFAGLAFSRRAALLLRWWDRPEGVDLLCYTPDEFARKMREVGIMAEGIV